MANKKFKLGYGNEANINTALAAQTIDGGDLVVTKDTHRFAMIDPNTDEVIYIKSKNPTFTSMETAQQYAKTDVSAFAGELIIVVEDQEMKTYQLKPAESGYDIEEFGVSNADIEDMKTQAVTEAKEYTDSALTITEF